MRRTSLVFLLAFLAGNAPAYALFTDDATQAMILAEDKMFHAFMKIQMVQQLLVLKQNYDASVRYINEFKQLNSGRGILQNIATQLKTAQLQQLDSFKGQLNDAFVQPSSAETPIDKFFKNLDQAVANNIKYAGDEAANLISNRKVGENIASSADGLSPKDAAILSAKAQGIQVQVLGQLHEDNLRIIQLSSMQLAGEARRQEAESNMVQGIRQSIQNRYPNAGTGTEDER